MQIAVLTGGGDVPGLNAAIRGLLLEADANGDTVVGVQNGWAGLLGQGAIVALSTPSSVLLRTGGTILGSSRTNPLKMDNGREMVADVIRDHHIDAVVAIGGDDTLSVAAALAADGVQIVGVPKTMDFDLDITEYCIGFDTAVSVATDAVDRLQTTGASHHRIMVLEVMGRDTGWVALHAGIAGGAQVILLPEFPQTQAQLLERMKDIAAFGDRAPVVVVAEGYPLDTNKDVSLGHVDAFGHQQLSEKGIASEIATLLEAELGIETRATVLGHIQRGGTPTAYDRIWATRVGAAAHTLLLKEQFGWMSTVQNGTVVPAKIADVTAHQKRVPQELFDVAQRMVDRAGTGVLLS